MNEKLLKTAINSIMTPFSPGPLPNTPAPPAPPAMEVPLDVQVHWIEVRVRKLELRTLLLAVIGAQTALTLFLLMIIIKLVT